MTTPNPQSATDPAWFPVPLAPLRERDEGVKVVFALERISRTDIFVFLELRRGQARQISKFKSLRSGNRERVALSLSALSAFFGSGRSLVRKFSAARTATRCVGDRGSGTAW
jgi:hypothetical protein